MNMADERDFRFSDLTLSRRLERAEGEGNKEFVEARAKVFPQSGAEWIEVAGAYLMFDGAASPVTQTFGLGLFQETSNDDMDVIERFFREREAPVSHEVSPLASAATVKMLNERGYQPIEFTSVMFRPLEAEAGLPVARNEKIHVRLVEEDEHQLWAQTSAQGWSEFTEYKDFILALGLVSAKRANGLSFLAELDGRAIATGAMSISDGVALLAGASTIPEGRGQGASTLR